MSLRPLVLPTILSLALLAPSRADAAASYTVTNLGAYIDPVAINAQGAVLSNYVPGIASQSSFVYMGYGPEAGREITIPDSAEARGMNNLGQVVGTAQSGRSYLASPDSSSGTTSYLTTESDYRYIPTAINDQGQIVGRTSTYLHEGYLQSGGKIIDLGLLVPTSINAFGQITGNLFAGNQPVGSNPPYATYNNDAVRVIGSIGDSSGYVHGSNAAGQVVGALFTPTDSHAFLYSGGQLTDLETIPGSNNSFASAINASGRIVGAFHTSTGAEHAFLDSEGIMRDLNALIAPGSGLTLVAAWGINDAGQIVGTAEDAIGHEFGFLLTPSGMLAPTAPALTPEPTSVAFFGVLAAGLVARLARRRSA